METKHKTTRVIELNQEKLAQILVNSFYYGEGDLDVQLDYWDISKEITGINILDFSPSELMRNKLIREKLVEAFKESHKEKKVKEEKIPGRIEFQLIKAFKRNQINKS